jgi:hypothetical protein
MYQGNEWDGRMVLKRSCRKSKVRTQEKEEWKRV